MDRDQTIVGVIVLFIILLLLVIASGMFGGGAPGGGGGGGGGGAGVPCAGSSECPSGQICLNGLCVPAGSCGVDADCPAGSLCVGGSCSAGAECSSEVPCPFGECDNGVCTGCVANEDCGPGEVCINNICSPSAPSCGSDTDCPAGYSCGEGGVCEASECSSTVPCPDGYKCSGGSCVPLTCPDDFLCPDGQVCTDGSCQVEPECSGASDCPDGEICNPYGDCEPAECTGPDDCPPGQECTDDGCVSLCEHPCLVNLDCGKSATCADKCCLAKTTLDVTPKPFGSYSLAPISFCDGCPAEDSLVSRMFLDPKLEDKKVGVVLFVEKDDGTRPIVETGTVFVQVLSLDLKSNQFCKMATDSEGQAYFDYSAYPVCEDVGCKITFTFCCSDISEVCLIPECLNNDSITAHEQVSPCAVAEGESAWPSSWPEQASVNGIFVNLFPAIDSISIPPEPKMMGVAFAFQLCFPILVIFGLLSAAMFASGRNPFEMFSLYSPHYKRAPERAIRPRGMNWNINSIISSVVSFAQTGKGMKKDAKGNRQISLATGAAKSDGKLPGFTIGGRVSQVKGTLTDIRAAARGGAGVAADRAIKSAGGGKDQSSLLPPKPGVGPVVVSDRMDLMAKVIGFNSLSPGKQLGKILGGVLGVFALKLISGCPGFSWVVYGGIGGKRKRDEKTGEILRDENGKAIWVPYEGLLMKLDRAMGEYGAASRVIGQAIGDAWATVKLESKTEKDGTMTVILTYMDPTTEKQVKKTFTDAGPNGPTALEQAGREMDAALAPLTALQTHALSQAVAEKQPAYASAYEDLSKSEEPSEKTKKQIKEMGEAQYNELQAKLAKGTATHEEALFAAYIINESKNDVERKETLDALAGFVASGNFDAALRGRLNDASSDKPIIDNTGLRGDHVRVDAAGVADEGLFVLGVVGHNSPAASGACDATLLGLMGDAKNPGIIGNLLSNNPTGNPLIFAENKERLAEAAEYVKGIAEYNAISGAYYGSANQLVTMEKELAVASDKIAMDAKGEGRQLTEEEHKKIEFSNMITDSLATMYTPGTYGAPLLSEEELMKRAAVDRAIDPTGKILQSDAVAEASKALSHINEEKSDPIYKERFNDDLAARYGMSPEQLEEIRRNAQAELAPGAGPGALNKAIESEIFQRGMMEAFSKSQEAGQAPPQEAPTTIGELNRMRGDAGLIALPNSFEEQSKAAERNAHNLVNNLYGEDAKTRSEAVEGVLQRWEDGVKPMELNDNANLDILRHINEAYPTEPSKTSRAEEAQEKSSPDASRKAYAAEQKRREEEFQKSLDSATRPEQGGINPFKTREEAAEERRKAEEEQAERVRKKRKGSGSDVEM